MKTDDRQKLCSQIRQQADEEENIQTRSKLESAGSIPVITG